MRMTKNLIKLLYIHFLFCTAFLFASCYYIPKDVPEYVGGPSHPSDIVTDVGTLKYIRTLWDMALVFNGIKIDNEIWIYADCNDGDGGALYKGMDKSVSIPIEFVYENWFYFCRTFPYILPKGDYINFLVRDLYCVHYIVRVHKATMDRQYFRIPILDGHDPNAYCGNDDVFFMSGVYNNTVQEFRSFYMLNEACDNVIEITEQEFHDLYSPNPDYFTDDEGRYYRLNPFMVSVDNGKTWHRNTMQSNFPRSNNPMSIITQNDTVFILCMPLLEPVAFGGGIHEFKWETEGGEE